LRGIAFGVWAATLGWVLIRLLNGAGRNGTAAVIIVTGYVVNMGFNLVTSAMHVAPGQGMLLLGLGEASRSLVLLLGVVFALKERRKILSLIILSLLPALLMVALGLSIQGAVEALLPRLFAGGLACLVCIVFAIALLAPNMALVALGRVRRGFRVRES
jgi:putative peptidoglycan lipid II flippase